jgi:hypothetical protein
VLPLPILVASLLQLATAATFLVMALVAYRYGSFAQRAAEAEVERQGHPAGALSRGRVRFEERGIELALPLGIAALLVVLAALNLNGNELARIATWIFHTILLLGGGVITAQQVWAIRFMRSAFHKSGDPVLARINVAAVIDAATDVFPWWVRFLVIVRFALVTAGSVIVMILVGLPSAGGHYS